MIQRRGHNGTQGDSSPRQRRSSAARSQAPSQASRAASTPRASRDARDSRATSRSSADRKSRSFAESQRLHYSSFDEQASSARPRRNQSPQGSHARPRKDRKAGTLPDRSLAVSARGEKTLGAVSIESRDRGRSSRSSSRQTSRNRGNKGVLGFITGIFLGLFGAIFGLIRKSKILTVVCLLVVLIASGMFVDNLINGKKIYSGIYVGDVDLSGLTVDEAEDLIFERYSEQLQGTRIVVFANEQASAGDVEEMIAQQEALAEQLSVEEARESIQLWVVTADSLAASVPAYDLASEAYQMGRETGGIFLRLKSLAFDSVIEPYASYDDQALEALCNEIDLTLGDPRVDWGVVISEGQASLVEGHDGYMVNRDNFRKLLDDSFLTSNELEVSFIAQLEFAPIRITQEQAQTAVDYTNGILAKEVSFAYGDQSWQVPRETLGTWITTEVITERRSHKLNVLLDPAIVKPQIFLNMQEALRGLKTVVQMEEKDGNITVITDGTVEVPQLDDAVYTLDKALFTAYRDNANVKPADDSDANKEINAEISESGSSLVVSIQNGLAPQSMSFDEALELGVVSEISTYTTEYVNSASTENRRHNIHLAADKISGSIVKANGGRWSFNERVGEATAEAGFLGAGAIVSGELNDAVGGGICQVATTVFNSVYESGFPVVTRHNHTLYIASDPAGRDAAIAYPYMDLIWENDSHSDVLILCTYTDSSLTVKLYGVDPGYEVSSKEGEWEDGEEFESKTIVDETLKPGTSRVETAGRNGKKITVYRTVTDSAGQILHEDSFKSVYQPVNEVIIAGPEVPEEEKKESEQTEGS